MSGLAPAWARRLLDPAVRTVLLAGCGGGFDFVHAVTLLPELRRLGKRVIINSYSFGRPEHLGDPAPVVFERDGVIARLVTAATVPSPDYAPEVHLASFLDERLPADAPHALHACYARDFTVPLLSALYAQLVRDHAVDAVVIVDGGSDSLMAGDEEGLGDPVEDAVSVATVARLDVPVKLLLTIGLGCDRFNHVSDAASLRAIAELTAAGGFLGALGLERDGEAFRFYRDCLDHLDRRQPFKSVLAGAIVSSGEGHFGRDAVPYRLQTRVRPGELFLWPLMSVLWGFDPVVVAARSRLCAWVRDQPTVAGCYEAVARGRAALPRRPLEDVPPHVELRGPSPGLFREA